MKRCNIVKFFTFDFRIRGYP